MVCGQKAGERPLSGGWAGTRLGKDANSGARRWRGGEMTLAEVAGWMLAHLHRDGCIYQDDVVDMLTKHGADAFLRENADGNLVLGRPVLDAFMKISTK